MDVIAGTVWVNGDFDGATGAINVTAGAALGGTGTIGGNVAIADGATLAPGAGGAGTLVIGGDLELLAGSTLAFEFGEANAEGGTLNDLVTVGGDLTLDGTINVSVSAGGAFGTGVYRVFNYAGALTDNGLSLGSAPASDVTVQTSIAGQVNLVNSAGLALNFWDGTAGPKNNGAINGGDGIWQHGTGNDNWTDEAGTVNAAYVDSGFAVFGGTRGAVTVDGSLGDVSSAGMQFATDGYTIGGDAITLSQAATTIRVGDGSTAGAGYSATIGSELSGNSQLVKTDAGTLILTGANSYAGGTAINGGTVQIASDANLGAAAGALTLNGGTLATRADLSSARAFVFEGQGTLATAADTTFTYNGLLSGSGPLTKQGTGTLLLTGDNGGYTGVTSALAGTLGVEGTLGSLVDVAQAGRLEGTGRVGGITNSGVVAPGLGGIGTLTVAGDYAGNGGTLEIEAVLGTDSSAADRLVVNGATSGNTLVSVINRDGLGGQTAEGIRIIDVIGASDGTFALSGDYVFNGEQAIIAGAYGYRLYQGGTATPTDGDWYLRSSLLNPVEPEVPNAPLYQPGVPVYEAYGANLQALNGLPTLQQRVGNRSWAPGSDPEGSGIWGRVEGTRTRAAAAVSTSFADQDIDSWKLQLGADGVLAETGQGERLVAGVTAYYGGSDSEVRSAFGNGTLKTDGYGFGATLTWYGDHGVYLDGQMQVSWYRSDLDSDLLRKLTGGNEGRGEAFSFEAGKRAPLGGKLSLTPQIQMVYSGIRFDSFVDPAGAMVAADKGASLKSRWGVSLDHRNEWAGGRSHVYGLANLSYEWLDGTRTRVSGTPIDYADERLWAEVGLGASVGWKDGVALFGEVSGNSPIHDFGDSYSVKGNAGIRIAF
jgi:fibronectin-binding autotransporter adhesin